ncbi:MAG: hypothetical protein ACE3JU_15340 [Paenibacillus sp.]|uniref:hypothetical protein n=1 Tax=Paenibacillus sp. TaxID=58172 RepID=UPI003B78177E
MEHRIRVDVGVDGHRVEADAFQMNGSVLQYIESSFDLSPVRIQEVDHSQSLVGICCWAHHETSDQPLLEPKTGWGYFVVEKLRPHYLQCSWPFLAYPLCELEAGLASWAVGVVSQRFSPVRYHVTVTMAGLWTRPQGALL